MDSRKGTIVHQVVRHPVSRSWQQRAVHTVALVLLLMIGSLQARCSVKDGDNQQRSVNSLPLGVFYDPAFDRIRCMEPESCKGWTIARCAMVQCKGENSCQGAVLEDIQGISCSAEGACQFASIFQTRYVSCGLEYANTCRRAIITGSKAVYCYGKSACAPNNENGITINVGNEGIVRCANGQGSYSCENLEVEISHGHRACFATSLGEAVKGNKCAVFCEAEGECHSDSIQFHVLAA